MLKLHLPTHRSILQCVFFSTDTFPRVNSFLCPSQISIWNWFTTPFTVGETEFLHKDRIWRDRDWLFHKIYGDKDLQVLIRALRADMGMGWHYFRDGEHFNMNWVLTMTSGETPALKCTLAVCSDMVSLL